MAGVATVKINFKVTGIGNTVEANPNVDAQTLAVPVELANGYIVVATATTTAIQLSDIVPQIALAKMYRLYVESEVGTIYMSVDTAGTGTITSSTADMILNVGESCIIPINPSGNLGFLFDAAAITDAFSFIVLGKA